MASSVLFAGPAKAGPAVNFRKSLSTLDANAPEISALRSAIPAMQQSGLWDRLVAIHSQDWRQHHSWLFLPWHRAFLYEFELAVRRLTYDDFRMPYLDWDADKIPALLFDPPFAHDGRTHGPDDSMRDFQGSGGWFWQSAPRPFADFFGRVDFGGDDESYGHNLVHIFVGGDMGNIQTAPRDPLFWFHHANVDRLWWHWDQQYGCTSSDCFPSDWLSERVNGIEDPDGSAVQPIAVQSLLSTQTMGYDYQGAPMVMMSAPIAGGVPHARSVTRPVYAKTFRLLAEPQQATTVLLPQDLLIRLLTASRAEVDAPLFVRSNGSTAHEIRITLAARKVLKQESIFAMPMGGGMGGSSYVKNIGGMLESLAQDMPVDAAIARLESEPISLRVEARALKGAGSGMAPELVQCTCQITAKTWA
jgi:tyrosinase